jgi:hypothetical protein
MHRGDIDPVDIGFETPVDLGRVDADIVVMVGAPQRMDPALAVALRKALSSPMNPSARRALLPTLT